jgi:hypothetical protein
MVSEPFTGWLADGIDVVITEADVLADLDDWSLTIPDPLLLEEAER